MVGLNNQPPLSTSTYHTINNNNLVINTNRGTRGTFNPTLQPIYERKRPPIVIILALCLVALVAWNSLGAGIIDTRRRYTKATASYVAINAEPNKDITEFVQVKDGRFVVGSDNTSCGRSFYISGYNQWEAFEASAGALTLYGASIPDGMTGPSLVMSMLDKAADTGFNVLRTWGHTVSPQYQLMSAPGVYNEAVFKGLDFLLDEARKRGIRVLLAITDNWQKTGGVDQYVGWAAAAQNGSNLIHEDFFFDETIKQMYKDHVAVLIHRINTVNGRQYKEDPTILAWELVNEPRCFECEDTLMYWAAEMSEYIKSMDAQHMITIGEEGFYPLDTVQMAANPKGNNSWAFWEGQNFLKDHDLPHIDFMAMHFWPQNWEDYTEEFITTWIMQHIQDARALKKPLLLEEFGAFGNNERYREIRDKVYYQVYSLMEANARQGGPSAAGAMFWQFYAEGQKAPAEEDGEDGGIFGVFETDSTWKLIQSFTRSMADLSNQPLLDCSVLKRPAALSVVADTSNSKKPYCLSSRVHGRYGTGLEGHPKCDLDINECSRGTADCDPNAACINTYGSYSCTCHMGYTGDGRSCTPTPLLESIKLQYTTLGRRKVACNQGNDVVYEELYPGYAYDVLGGSKGGSEYGSRVHVTPLQCMIACEMAAGCDSFSYSPEGRSCFLKSGGSLRVCEKPESLCVSTRGTTYACGTWQTYWKADKSELVIEEAGTSKLALSLKKQATNRGLIHQPAGDSP